MNEQTPIGETVKVNCVNCKSPTQHEVLRAHQESGSNEDVNWYAIDYQIVRCMGCQNICFRESSRTSEDLDAEGTPEEFIRIYPNPPERSPAVDVWALPERVRVLYQETLTCLHSGAKTLAAAGLRSVVEATCKDQGCVKGNLRDKIDELVTRGVFLKRDADYLHQHRFLGNEAVHELAAPPGGEFELALQILEHLLASVYVMPRSLSEYSSTSGVQIEQNRYIMFYAEGLQKLPAGTRPAVAAESSRMAA